MTVSYLSSMSARQSYAAKTLFEGQISVPPLTPQALRPFIENAERLFLTEHVKLEIGGKPLDFRDLVSRSDNREGATILEAIANKLAGAFTGPQDRRVVELAHYEVAGLVSSPDFWDAVESALRETVNRDAVGGELRLERVSQLGMNIVLAKDGKSLECHLVANWKEYRQGNDWHAMSDLSPVLKARARILIGLKPARDGHRLEASFVHLHANSPLPEIRERLLQRQPTFGEKLLNALASIPLLGRLFRGTQIKLTIGEDLRSRRIAYLPALPSDLQWLGTEHERHQTDERALGRHVIAKKLKHKPNWVRTLPLGVSQIGADNLQENQPAPLKALLDHRPQDLQRKAHVLRALDQNAQQPQVYIPDAPADIPPLGDNQARIAELESQLQAMQQELEAERRLREQSEAERDTARSDAAILQQRVAVAESERNEVGGELERVRSQYQQAKQRIQDQTAQLARHEAKRAAKAIATLPVEQVIHRQMVAAADATEHGTAKTQRNRAMTLPGPSASSSSTVANNAAVSNES